MGRAATDTQFASYLMYPKVFPDFAATAPRTATAHAADAGLFLRHEAGRRDLVEIEHGKTLVVRFVALSRSRDDGKRQVFFELNGQPRSIVVPDRSQVAKRPPQRKAEPGNAKHVGAPMPGVIATVKAKRRPEGGRRCAADIEAMKMETSVHAETDGTVAEVLVKPGLQVDAKDLLVVLS